jgi:fatty acid CoA ligase FadD28
MVTCLSAVVREHASLQPNKPAFTYIDYESNWDGVRETLTWSQLYRRSRNLAQQLRLCGSTGDRAVILAPQGLDYIVAFLGAIEAGLVAVPLSLPTGGAADSRVSSVLQDSSPAVVLTTSAVVVSLADYLEPQPGQPAPKVVEVDLLDLDTTQRGPRANLDGRSTVAYLQYTSGSTRAPAGVMISNKNILANFEQISASYFTEYGKVPPSKTTVVSWLPLYHDMGLYLGVLFPILAGLPAVIFSPAAFLQRPARWMQLLATESSALSAAPNFAFDLAARKTTDEDMAGLDLGGVLDIMNGSERVQAATLRRFADRFARFNLPEKVIRPSYGMAEAVIYIASRTPIEAPKIVHFDAERLTAGQAIPTETGNGTPLVSYGMPQSPLIRIVDHETSTLCQDGTVGEIWAQGDNVATSYWQKPDETTRTFGGKILAPPARTPGEPWLRTGDLGFISNGELYVLGRLKDTLIVYGRNHSPDDIESTIQEINRGRCAAIAVAHDHSEKLVVVLEYKNNDGTDEAKEKIASVKREVTSAMSKSHGLNVSDIVLVPHGSMPTTTSGKIRRSTCVELYNQGGFERVDGELIRGSGS